MRLAGVHVAVRRVWTVELRPHPGGPSLICPRCTAHTSPLHGGAARSAALSHLASHARAESLPGHLRTCQCRAQGCCWHPRHRGCAGPVRLALTRDRSGRTWRLADTCTACAAATSHTAVVPDTLLGSTHQPSPCAPTRRGDLRPGPKEHVRVREMLSYLAAALPRYTSPAARLLALQCALRADLHGHVQLPAGLMRGMRLHGRGELVEELAHTGWLRLTSPRRTPLQMQLLDGTALDQAPGRKSRRRAAHWAMRPVPLTMPASAPPAVQLTVLVLAAHIRHGIDMDTLARLNGHSPHQVEELLDRLVATRRLVSWSRHPDTDEVTWHLPSPPEGAHRCQSVRPRRPQSPPLGSPGEHP
ncbi:hypothetical protein ACFPH6_33090 [Streptomyces xiangluensis]|uniref:TniQ protein n=1 Tax=Streptomyces xiangluensis TaxID=2665720 RepID=A0ABV8YYG0_9ACTN